MKKVFYSLLIAGLLLSSCSDDSDDVQKEEEQQEEEQQEEEQQTKEENSVDLPKGFLIVESDTFYISSTTRLPDPNFNRVQLNLSNKDDLVNSSNDGGTASTIGLVISTQEAITESGSLSYTSFRSVDGSDKVNFYMSFFLNTGHSKEGANFLSPSEGTFNFTLIDDTFKAEIENLTMTNEADETQSFSLSGVIEY